MSKIIGNKKYYYFDNAATTFPKPNEVYEEMKNCEQNYCVNSGRGQYKLAAVANKVISDTRTSVEKLFNCTSDYSCVFTDSATTALNTIIQGLVVKENCNIYITSFEHNSVLRPLYKKQKENKIIIQELKFDTNSCTFNLQEIKNSFNDNKPEILIMTHASNSFGFITPVEEIAECAKKINKNCIVIIDCAQTAGLVELNLSTNLFDYIVFAGHKTLYGPFGIAGFVCRKDSPLKSFTYGGTGIDSKNLEMPTEIPNRFEAGSHNIISIAGLNEALKIIEKNGIGYFLKQDKILREKLLSELLQFNNIKIIGNKKNINYVGIVSVVFENYTSDEIGNVLDKFNICVRTGLHCAPLGHKIMGTFPAGTVRFSVGRFTNDEDFCALHDALKYINENG